jgi:perosamine synthetase
MSDSFRLYKASRTGWLTQAGPEVTKMESNIRKFLEIENSDDYDLTSASNGTTALHLSLLALGIGRGDEVIIPDYCYVAVVNSVLYCGATPVVVDCEWSSWSISIDSIVPYITSKTKAVIVVDNYGFLANIKEIRAKLSSNIALILDMAESFPNPELFSRIHFADLCTFSLYANKIVTAGEGGGIIGRRDLIEPIKLIKNQSLSSAGSFTHSQIGYNYRITNLSAAIFNSQWRRLSQILRLRERVFELYHNAIYRNNIEIISDNIEATPWLYTVVLPVTRERRDLIRSKLAFSGIETRPGFTTIKNLPYRPASPKESQSFPVSDSLSSQSISLPTYPSITRKEIEIIIHALEETIDDSTISH